MPHASQMKLVHTIYTLLPCHYNLAGSAMIAQNPSHTTVDSSYFAA